MKAVKYAVVVERPGYAFGHIVAVVSGRRALFSALRDEINADCEFYWNKRMSTLSDVAKYGGAYYAHDKPDEIMRTLSVWALSDLESELWDVK